MDKRGVGLSTGRWPVPTALSVAALAPVAAEPGRDFAYVVLPRAGHGLIDAPNGLNAEASASSRFAAGLWTTLRDWLRARGLSGQQLPRSAANHRFVASAST